MRFPKLALFVLVLSGCGFTVGDPTGGPRGEADKQISLADARRGFQTKLARQEKAGQPAPQPPPNVFTLVQYDSPAGKLSAYLTPEPADDYQHPAIIWITGGDCNTIDEGLWSDQPRDNEQNARAFRDAGIVQMFPSLRGGNNNPGFREGFYGEVDDVIAAASFLADQDYVDSDRIYLGGHSTGGTLTLLVAAASDKFRAVFSFGPVDDTRGYGYGSEFLPFDTSNEREFELRAPARWLHSIKRPVFIFEGAQQPSNLDGLTTTAKGGNNPQVHFHPVKGANHFSILYPVTRLIARKIVGDEGPATNISFTDAELSL